MIVFTFFYFINVQFSGRMSREMICINLLNTRNWLIETAVSRLLVLQIWMSKEMGVACESEIYFGELLLISVLSCLYRLSSIDFKVSVKENEVLTEKNSSRASIFATKASYISN